jgi:Kef-type K+ transport system membrane component KefB
VTLNNILFAMALTAVWVSIAVAVLKYRLYDIDRIISRTLAYAVVIGVLAAIYVGLVTAIGSQFEGSLSVAASTLAVAALFNPLRRRVQGWVDRHFNRSAYDTGQVMDEFAGSLRDEVDADSVVEGWVEVVEETMQPSAVGVWVR